jgi:hypothetical protein
LRRVARLVLAGTVAADTPHSLWKLAAGRGLDTAEFAAKLAGFMRGTGGR